MGKIDLLDYENLYFNANIGFTHYGFSKYF